MFTDQNLTQLKKWRKKSKRNFLYFPRTSKHECKFFMEISETHAE